MTSTTGGQSQPSYGWINYEHIESGKSTPHINVYGGEERFWLGPEGGQFSIFFPPGGKFELADWQTPPAIDTRPAWWTEVKLRSPFAMRHAQELFREPSFISASIARSNCSQKADAEKSLGVELGDVRMVGYRSTNRLTNIGENDWKKQTGLLSIWILGMYRPGPQTTVVVPFRSGRRG